MFIQRMMAALALAGWCGGTAGAANLDFGAAYRTGAGGSLFQAGVSDVTFAGGTVSAALSNRAAEVSLTRSVGLPPAGGGNARLDAALVWRGGLRLSAGAAGTLGPVALNLGAAFFTAGVTAVDPLAAWTLAPADLRASGWNADFTARYRVSRTLIAVAGGEFGPQNHLLGGAEWRRDLIRVLPPAQDNPQAEPETERTGTLALRLGGRVGRDVLGVTGGVTYSSEAGLSLALDALAGPGKWGVLSSVTAPDVLGEGSTARLYVAYEPWRRVSAPLRAGVESTLPVGSGTLRVDVRGGTDGVGARISYRVPLGSGPDRAP